MAAETLSAPIAATNPTAPVSGVTPTIDIGPVVSGPDFSAGEFSNPGFADFRDMPIVSEPVKSPSNDLGGSFNPGLNSELFGSPKLSGFDPIPVESFKPNHNSSSTEISKPVPNINSDFKSAIFDLPEMDAPTVETTDHTLHDSSFFSKTQILWERPKEASAEPKTSTGTPNLKTDEIVSTQEPKTKFDSVLEEDIPPTVEKPNANKQPGTTKAENSKPGFESVLGSTKSLPASEPEVSDQTITEIVFSPNKQSLDLQSKSPFETAVSKPADETDLSVQELIETYTKVYHQEPVLVSSPETTETLNQCTEEAQDPEETLRKNIERRIQELELHEDPIQAGRVLEAAKQVEVDEKKAKEFAARALRQTLIRKGVVQITASFSKSNSETSPEEQEDIATIGEQIAAQTVAQELPVEVSTDVKASPLPAFSSKREQTSLQKNAGQESENESNATQKVLRQIHYRWGLFKRVYFTRDKDTEETRKSLATENGQIISKGKKANNASEVPALENKQTDYLNKPEEFESISGAEITLQMPIIPQIESIKSKLVKQNRNLLDHAYPDFLHKLGLQGVFRTQEEMKRGIDRANENVRAVQEENYPTSELVKLEDVEHVLGGSLSKVA